MNYDVIVIGAGPAGQSVAIAAADAGKSVAMTEGRDYGGTCPLRGCDPKILLHAAAETMFRTDRMRGKGFTSAPGFSWPDLMEWKRSFTEPLPEEAQEKMDDHGINTYSEYATFVDAHTLRFGDQEVRGETIVLATGMKPAPLDIPGKEHLLTSDDFLDMDDLPAEMVIIGSGYIGSESGHISHALGCKITMIASQSVPLSKFDSDLSRLLMKADQKRGIQYYTNHKAVAVRKQGNRYEVDAEDENGKITTLTTDRVLHCAGRVPNTKSLDLDAAGIEYDDKLRIKVNGKLQTNVPHIYAVGDCNDSGLPLTPVGNYEAEVLNGNLFGDKDDSTDLDTIPTVAFCLPGMASVGMTQQEYEEVKESRNISRYYKDASDFYHARHINSPAFAFKLFVDEDEQVLLGAHLLGPGVTEMINVLYMAIVEKVPVDRLGGLIYAYPTAASTIKSMLK